MIKELERMTNNSLDKVIKLNGELIYDIDYTNYKNKTFPFNGLIDINKSNVVIDGSNSTIQFNIKNLDSNDCVLFYIHAEAENVEFRNLNIKVRIENDDHANAYFMFIYNTARNFKLFNSNIEISSERQINIIGIYNYGALDTHLETPADNVLIDGNILRVFNLSPNNVNNCKVYGIYNNLANSITISKNYINTIISGKSDEQRSIGIYTNGRFGRIIGNNIKANASHSDGLELEQASAYGVINEGVFSIINSNNIIAEWAGIAIGVENKGNFAIISSNKILSTHNIMGICIRNCANKLLLENNIIVSTSKNARLIEHQGSSSNISNNILEVLLPKTEVSTGCGIYSTHSNIKDNIVSGNIICNVKNCGIIINPLAFSLSNNRIIVDDNVIPITHSDNISMLDTLSERNIKTIIRE